MERIVHYATSFKEAESLDIKQQIDMTSEERQSAAKELRERYFGKNIPDVREIYKKTWKI